MSIPDRPWLGSYESGVPHTVDPTGSRFDALLASAAADAPNQPAVTFFNRTYTFAEIDNLVSRAAAAVRRQGVRPGDAVWVALPSCAHWVMAVLGVMRAGGLPIIAPPYLDPALWPMAPTGSAPRLAIVTPRQAAAWHEAMGAPGIIGAPGSTTPMATATTLVVVDPQADFPLGIRLARLARQGLRHRQLPAARPDVIPWAVWTAGAKSSAAQDGVDPDPEADAAIAVCFARPDDGAATIRAADTTRILDSTRLAGMSPAPSIAFTHRHLVAGALQLRVWLTDVIPGDDAWLILAPPWTGLGLVAGLGAAVMLRSRVVLIARTALDDVRDIMRYLRPVHVVCSGDSLAHLAWDARLAECDMRSVRTWLVGDPFEPEIASAFQGATGLAICRGLTLPEVAGLATCQPANAIRDSASLGVPMPSVEMRVAAARAAGPAPEPIGGRGLLEIKGPNIAAADAAGWLNTGLEIELGPDGWLHPAPASGTPVTTTASGTLRMDE